MKEGDSAYVKDDNAEIMGKGYDSYVIFPSLLT